MGRFATALHPAAMDAAASNLDLTFYRGVPPTKEGLFRPNAMGLVFVSPSKEEAQMFGGQGSQVIECKVLSDNIFEGWNPEHLEKAGYDPLDSMELRLFDSAYVENPKDVKQIRSAGFDGFYVRDYPMHPLGFMNIALFGNNKLEAL